MTTYRKQGDTSPELADQLLDDEGDVVPITKYNEVELHMEDIDGNTAIDADTSSGVSVPNSDEGIVEYDFQSGDLDEDGTYIYEWKVTFNNGEKITFPNRTDGEVLIVIPD